MTSEIEDHLHRAAEAASLGNPWAARRRYRKAERLARKAGLPRIQALAAEKLADLACRYEGFAEALTHIDIAIEAWEQAQEPVWQALVLLDRAKILEKADRWHEARLAYRRAGVALKEVRRSYEVLSCEGAIERLGDRIAQQAHEDRRAGGPRSSRGRFLSPRIRALMAPISLLTGRPVRPPGGSRNR